MESKKKKLTVKCPICKTSKEWEGNPYRPFCSERCKIIDLGNWADGSYHIEKESSEDTE